MIDLLREFATIVKAFNRRRIRYCVIGGLAVGFYARPRFTDDIDFLVHEEDIPKIRERMESLDIPESAQPWVFKSTSLTLYRFMKIEGADTMLIDVLAARDERHLRIISESVKARSSFGLVRVARPEDLIWMKMKRNSNIDKEDIERLTHDAYRTNARKAQ